MSRGHTNFSILTVRTPGFHHLRNDSPRRSVFIDMLFKHTVLLIRPRTLPSIRYSSLSAVRKWLDLLQTSSNTIVIPFPAVFVSSSLDLLSNNVPINDYAIVC